MSKMSDIVLPSMRRWSDRWIWINWTGVGGVEAASRTRSMAWSISSRIVLRKGARDALILYF